MRNVILIVSACLCAATASYLPSRVAAASAANPPAAVVTVVALPEGGIQPQAVVDATGIIHVLYFSGDPAAGDLYYATLTGQGKWSVPVLVNSIRGSALAAGSVRGAQLSLSPSGVVHAAWHGSKPLAGGSAEQIPMWYARSTGHGRSFEPQRVVSGEKANGLDGGSVAADQTGHVVVAWHAMGAKPGEGSRTVYLAKSSDDGATFSAPAPATAAPIGACGCCGMRALFDRRGALHVLYRAATDAKHRDTTWLMIDGGPPRPPVRVHPWELESCPMSTYALAETADGVAAAWETAQQIYSADLNPATGTVSRPAAMPGSGSRKHPSIAVNAAGDRLIAWAEGTAWKRGGRIAWRLTDRNGNERSSAADAGPVPVWGLVSAVAMPDGSFTILR